MDGMSSRAIAIIAPGMFLSHPPTATRPSMASPLHTVSMESAITSRDTSEYFMPSVPMEIASLTVIVPKVWGMVPAARRPASARAARRPRPALQGVTLLWALATPTIGLPKSASPKPTARSIARLGARCTPSVTSRLLWFSGMALPSASRTARLSCVVHRSDPRSRTMTSRRRDRARAALLVFIVTAPAGAPAALAQDQAALFAYDAAADLKLRTAGVERREGATVVDLLFDDGSGSGRRRPTSSFPHEPGPHAGVLWVHWLGEPATTNRTQFLAEAVALAPKGFASLLVDAMWSKPKWYEQRVPEEDFDNSRKQVVALRRAMDVLQSQSGVDKARLGVVGHDYGGMYAMLMAGADPRAKTYVYVATAPSLSHWAFFANQPKSKVEYLRQNAVLELSDALRQVNGREHALPVRHARRLRLAGRHRGAAWARPGPKERKLYDAEHDMAGAADRGRPRRLAGQGARSAPSAP